jgi:hypothetical protein
MRAVFFLCIFFSSLSIVGESSNFECDPKKFLPENLIEKVLVHRETSFQICLNCEGKTCSFKQELLQDERSQSICKRLFCTPSFASRGFEIPPETPRGKSSFNYNYTISNTGMIKDIKIISVEGVFSSRDAREFIKALTRKTKYIPIEFQDDFYELTNLESKISINTRLGYE